MLSEKRLDGIEVLIVEDSTTQAVQLRFLFQECGYRVTVAANGQGGLAAVRQHKPHLIISDIIMPVMTGYEMCHAIKQDKALQDIPVILLTSLSDPEDIVRGLKAGADYYVTKPYDEGYLLSAAELALVTPVREKGGRAEEGLEITFAGERHVITSDRQQILNLLLSTYGNAVQQNRELIQTQRELETLNQHLEERVRERTVALRAEIAERKRAEEKLEHLNLVLRAVRSVNQLIVREKDRARLLQGACDNLIKTRGYHNAWIALLDEAGGPALSGVEGLVATTEAGLGERFAPLVERLKRGEWTACGQRALSQSEVVVTEDPPATCADCPLAANYGGQGALTIRLEHGDKVYGLLSASIPAHLTTDGEEQVLFEEVAGDIAFALHSIELEERRKRAEEALREHREHLEELVAERTAELRKMVNLMAGREVRMAELKDVIRQLRVQLEEAGLTPAADDPLLGGESTLST